MVLRAQGRGRRNDACTASRFRSYHLSPRDRYVYPLFKPSSCESPCNLSAHFTLRSIDDVLNFHNIEINRKQKCCYKDMQDASVSSFQQSYQYVSLIRARSSACRLVTVGACPSPMESGERRWSHREGVCYGPLLRLMVAPSRLVFHISATEDPHIRCRVALLDTPLL
eukprot:6173154-Pleurochrysis_carterae.AAC.1